MEHIFVMDAKISFNLYYFLIRKFLIRMFYHFNKCFFVLLGVFLFSGCSDQDNSEKVGIDRSPIYEGQKDNDPISNSVVQIFSNNSNLCSGVVISKKIVVTAYHCVAETVLKSVSCNPNEQDSVSNDFAPSSIKIFTGDISDIGKSPLAVGMEVFHPVPKKLCANDIAFVVLNKTINVDPVKVRTKPHVDQDETFKVVGYGLNNLNILGKYGDPVGVKLFMDRVPLMGKSSSEFWLKGGSLNQEKMHGGACSGDSGGPAFSEKTRSLVGVLSRGGACETDSPRTYSFVGSHLDILNKAISISGTHITEEDSDSKESGTAIESNSGEALVVGSPLCSHGNGHGPSMLGLFFVLVMVVTIIRKYSLI